MMEAAKDVLVTYWRKIKESRSFMVMVRPLLILLITLNSVFTKQRMSHENGLVARGKVRLVDDLQLPENNFFKPGAEFDCSLRHASVSFMDDAAMVVRAGSLKFSNDPIDSPFDMLMNNGVATPFWNMDTFWQFMNARRKGGRAHLIPYFRRNPRCYFNVRDALRLNPDSFAHLEYYNQTPLEFISSDSKKRYAKFRLIPSIPIEPPSGIPTEEELQTPWFQGAKSRESRTRNYLKDEYRERLITENIEYRFQIQLLEWDPLFDRAIELNSLYSWDEKRYPWQELAHVTMNKAVDHEEGNKFIFSLNNLPSALRVIPALGITDGPSIDYLRLGGIWPRRARLLMYRLFGQSKPIPEQRHRTAVQNKDRTTTVVISDDIYMRPSLPQNDDPKRQFLRKRQINRSLGLHQYIHGFIRTSASSSYRLWQPPYWYQRVFHIYESDPPERETVPLPLPPFIRELSALHFFTLVQVVNLCRLRFSSFKIPLKVLFSHLRMIPACGKWLRPLPNLPMLKCMKL